LRSFLAVEELTGMLPLHEAIPLAAARLAAHDFLRWKRGLIAELARLARLLHDRRHFHKDLYLCHFFVHADDVAAAPESWHGRVWLIDLHRLAHHPRTWPVWVVKDLAQLLYSSEVKGLTAGDRLRFWRLYRPAGAGGRLWRWLRAAILFKWRRYRRHNRKRQAQA
jgi:heptose I phosphotransferase